MESHSFLYSKTFNPWAFLFWYGLYILNDYLFKKERWQAWLWDMLKCEWFYIDGRCQHSGYCCQHIRLRYNKNDVKEYGLFAKLKQQLNGWDRFLPVYDNKAQIRYFNCSCLLANNRCADYQNRPNICRQYPFSSFIEYDYIRQGCGYTIKERKNTMAIRYKPLLRRIEHTKKRNHL